MTSPAPPSTDAPLPDAAFGAVETAVARGALPCAVLAIADRQNLLRVNTFGPVRDDSIFLIASITKPIFCTAVMRLVERGQLLLNEPVARHIPEFAAGGKADVRLWHLLTHTSGLDESWVFQAGGRLGRADARRIIELSCQAPLQFRPGSRYAYCNMSFFIMAELLRRVTGQDHAAHLHEQVLGPLEMVDTTYTPPAGPRVAPVLDPPWTSDETRARWIANQFPAGGLWSTAADLVRFGQCFLRRGAPVLAPATCTTMTALHTQGIPETTATGEYPGFYGLGFGKTGPRNHNGPSAELRSAGGFGHGGATGTYLWVEPELELVFVFLTNRWGTDDDTFRRALNAAIAARSLGVIGGFAP